MTKPKRTLLELQNEIEIHKSELEYYKNTQVHEGEEKEKLENILILVDTMQRKSQDSASLNQLKALVIDYKQHYTSVMSVFIDRMYNCLDCVVSSTLNGSFDQDNDQTIDKHNSFKEFKYSLNTFFKEAKPSQQESQIEDASEAQDPNVDYGSF